jgi:adenosylhomocysteine nucleosidase
MLGIITAVETERDAALTRMTDIKASNIYGIEFYSGSIENHPCVIALAGVGKVNAARCTQLMIDRFSPKRIVNIGSAGGLHPEVKIGDVVISTSCVQYDVILTAFGIKQGSFTEDDDGFIDADPDFIELCKKAMARCVGKEYRIFTGPIATGDEFNNSPERKNQLYQDFGAYCNEMEGAAVAQVCALCGVPFVIIRSISDKSDNDTVEMYNNFKVLAAERCADFLTQLMIVMQEQSKKCGGVFDESQSRVF